MFLIEIRNMCIGHFNTNLDFRILYLPFNKVSAIVRKRVQGHTSSSPMYPGLTWWRSRPSCCTRLMSKAGMLVAEILLNKPFN